MLGTTHEILVNEEKQNTLKLSDPTNFNIIEIYNTYKKTKRAFQKRKMVTMVSKSRKRLGKKIFFKVKNNEPELIKASETTSTEKEKNNIIIDDSINNKITYNEFMTHIEIYKKIFEIYIMIKIVLNFLINNNNYDYLQDLEMIAQLYKMYNYSDFTILQNPYLGKWEK